VDRYSFFLVLSISGVRGWDILVYYFIIFHFSVQVGFYCKLSCVNVVANVVFMSFLMGGVMLKLYKAVSKLQEYIFNYSVMWCLCCGKILTLASLCRQDWSMQPTVRNKNY